MSTDKASLFVPKRAEDADLCTETLCFPAPSLNESPDQDLADSAWNPGTLCNGKRVSEKVRHARFRNSHTILDAVEREGGVTGISEIQCRNAGPELEVDEEQCNDEKVELDERDDVPGDGSMKQEEALDEDNDCNYRRSIL
jgi:hypothetical protein